MMEKEFIPYEIALKLKELGFDEHCFGYFYTEDKFFETKIKNSELDEECSISAPTFSQALRWFREKYNIYHVIKPILGSKNGYDSFPILGWDYDIFITNKETKNSYYMGYPIGDWFTATLDRFDEGETLEDLNVYPLTYEEVELECLKRLIEIVNNGNI